MTSPAHRPSNPLLEPVRSQLGTGTVTLADGRKLARLTIQTTSAEVTIFATRDEAENWAQAIAETAAKIPRLAVATDPFPGQHPLPGMDGRGGR